MDGFAPGCSSFAECFASRPSGGRFLVELDHERATRAEWTTEEWRGRVGATARWLSERGVGPGDAVATLAGNRADALAVAFGCWVLGASCVPLPPGDAARRQAYVIRDAEVRLLLHSRAAAARAAELVDLVGVPAWSTVELPLDGEPPPPNGPPLDVPALRAYTSGTTGEPKGVVLTAANLLTDCDGLARALGWDGSTVVLTVLPIHHVNGMVISSLLPWFTGSRTVLCDRFRSDRFWSDVADEQATACSMVPTLLEFLLAAPGEAPANFRGVLCGAGPLLVETALRFEERFGIAIRHLYGLSETTCVATLMPDLDDGERRHWHRDFGFPCIGPAIPHAELAVLDSKSQPMPSGERGELAVRGPIVMTEYAGRAEETAAAFDEGWFHTGDEGFWEPGSDGTPWFFITGRMKELIIRGGVNISPFEIDEVIRSHPAVRYGLAVPFDSRFYGDEIAAYVVTGQDVTEADLLAHFARHLDFAHQPKVVVFGDDVPYTATGKAKRLELKRSLAARLADYRDTQFRKQPSGEVLPR